MLRDLHDPPAVSDPVAAAVVGQELDRIIGLERTVTPPRYGQAQALADAPWLDGMNLTPVARIAAATGARVVQAHQDELMAAAWEQVGEMQRANQERRQIDVAIAVGDSAMRRHIAPMDTDRMLQVSAPSGVPTSGGLTAAAVVADIPPATLSGAFRRLQRRTGSLARRSAPTPPGARLTMMALPQALAGASTMTVIDRFRLLQAAPDLVAQKKAAVLPFSEADTMPAGHSSALATFTFSGMRPADIPNGIPRPTPVTATVTVVGASVPWRLDDSTQFDSDDDPAALAARRAIALNFKTAALATQQYLFDRVVPRMNRTAFFKFVPPSDGAVVEARAAVLDELRPARALIPRVATPIAPAGSTAMARAATGATAADPPSASLALQALRYDPIFPQGMHRAIAELAPDLFLVDSTRLPDNAVGLVRTNARFIEAYLAGLNHEMAREFLWRGFPSDGRATYFRRFWDSDDGPPLSAWRGALGANVPTGDWLVLLIRGEIVRRFPRAVVFAQKGGLDATGGQFVPAAEARRYPRFRVTLGADLLCVGFDLTAAQASAYFFGIEEQITEPRFAPPTVPSAPYLKVSDLALRAGAHAGDVAAAMLRRPTRVMIDPHVLIT